MKYLICFLIAIATMGSVQARAEFRPKRSYAEVTRGAYDRRVMRAAIQARLDRIDAVQFDEIKTACDHVVTSSDAKLFALRCEELDQNYWFFIWNDSVSVEQNMYCFYDHLQLYERYCRMWEEHHNGRCCVVERVRDKYIMPKIRAFAAQCREVE